MIADDGSVTIYVQADPPKRWSSTNWLPVLKGPFSLLFRVYGPRRQRARRHLRPAQDPLHLPALIAAGASLILIPKPATTDLTQPQSHQSTSVTTSSHQRESSFWCFW